VPGDIEILTRERSTIVDGNVSDFEIGVINRLVKYNNPKTLFEIGTFDGRTTLNMAAHSGGDALVYTLDLPLSSVDDTALKIDPGDRMFIEKAASGLRFCTTDMAYKITQLYGDSATFDFSPYARKVDFLFVDGSHSYDYVIKDSLTALEIIRPNGIILWHDYAAEGPTAWPGVTKALEELYSGDARFSAMKNIAGTSIVMLQAPGDASGQANVIPRRCDLYGDSSQPEYLLASLTIDFSSNKIKAGSDLLFRAHAINTGRTVWLPSDAPIGPVRLGSHLLDECGTWLNANYSRHRLPAMSPVVPGQSVTFESRLPCPPFGRYVVEFDLVADGIAWFARNGPTAVRIPVEVQ
jgi:predicted O-methyltransferase YrrM